jgi:hypothetical protein
LETKSGVSGSVGYYRHMPICPTLSVVFCRRMSLCVGGHWGRCWGSRCVRGRSSPCSKYPIRGRNHRTYGLIRRLVLAALHVQLIHEHLRHKRHVICAGSCQCGYVM